jgi:hypothetical protein
MQMKTGNQPRGLHTVNELFAEFHQWVELATNPQLIAARSRAADQRKHVSDHSLKKEIQRMINIVNDELETRGCLATLARQKAYHALKGSYQSPGIAVGM